MSKRKFVIMVFSIFAGLTACSSEGNNPMLKGYNPTGNNPARLTGGQMDALIKDVSERFNQITADNQPGNVADEFRAAIKKVRDNPEKYTFRSESERNAFINQNVEKDAHASCMLEVYYFLLKYSGANVEDFQDYYIKAASKGWVTGSAEEGVDYMADPASLIASYSVNGKQLELISLRNKSNDGAKQNYLDLIQSGAALAHIRREGHSFIGYWDGPDLLRADTFHLNYEEQVMDGLSVVDETGTRPVEWMQIVLLKDPGAPPKNLVPFNPVTWKHRVGSFLRNHPVWRLLLITLVATLLLVFLLRAFIRRELLALRSEILTEIRKLQKK